MNGIKLEYVFDCCCIKFCERRRGRQTKESGSIAGAAQAITRPTK